MMTRLDLLLDQIRAARRYTEDLLGTIDPGDWFRMPAAGVTHVYLGVRRGPIPEYRIAGSAAFRRIYGQRGVSIYELVSGGTP